MVLFLTHYSFTITIIACSTNSATHITSNYNCGMRTGNEDWEWGLGMRTGNEDLEWGLGMGTLLLICNSSVNEASEREYVHMQCWRGWRQLCSCFVDCMRYILNSWPGLQTLWAFLVDVGGLCYSPGGGSPLGLGSQAGQHLYQEEEQHDQLNSSTTAYKGTDCAYI